MIDGIEAEIVGMRLTKGLEAVEEAYKRKSGNNGFTIVFAKDGESNEDAAKRMGLVDWNPATTVFLNSLDSILL